jgi:hypothetical protein
MAPLRARQPATHLTNRSNSPRIAQDVPFGHTNDTSEQGTEQRAQTYPQRHPIRRSVVRPGNLIDALAARARVAIGARVSTPERALWRADGGQRAAKAWTLCWCASHGDAPSRRHFCRSVWAPTSGRVLRVMAPDQRALDIAGRPGSSRG